MQALVNKIRGKFLEKVECPKSGSDSFFIAITKEVGVKLFVSKFMRDRNYLRFQDYYMIAPKVGAKFETEYNGEVMYGFFVEIVLTYHDMELQLFSDNRQEIYRIINNAGYDSSKMHDLHSGNLGRTFDGRPVILDFSRFTDDDGFSHTSLRGKSWMYDEYGDPYEIEVDDETGTWKIL